MPGRKPRGITEKRAIKAARLPAQQELTYIVCPLCGRSRILELSDSTIERKPEKSKRLRWDFFDPNISGIVQIRAGGGKVASDLETMKFRGRGSARGAGFRLKRALNLEEASKDRRFRDQIEAIKTQIKKLQIVIENFDYPR